MSTKTKKVEATVAVVETKKRGRKVNAESTRQIKMALKQTLIEQGIEIQRGRKIDPNSPRQQRLAALNEKRANGLSVGRGRPKKVVVE